MRKATGSIIREEKNFTQSAQREQRQQSNTNAAICFVYCKKISHKAHYGNTGYKVIYHAAISFMFFVYLVFFA